MSGTATSNGMRSRASNSRRYGELDPRIRGGRIAEDDIYIEVASEGEGTVS
ncbi:hypothetical protein D3C87_1586350 [compost metagenome]